MVRNQRPGQAGGVGFLQKFSRAFEELVPVIVVSKDQSALNPPNDDVVQGPRRINP
jgi:hypothetical protein